MNEEREVYTFITLTISRVEFAILFSTVQIPWKT